MKKVFFLLLLLSVSTFAQKKVLVEIFTNSHCGLCPNAHNAMESFYAATQMPENYISIYYHMKYPYNDDALYHHNTADSDMRDQYYGPFFGTPIAFFDGARQPGGSYSQWPSELQSLSMDSEELMLNLEGMKENNKMKISAEVMNLGQENLSDLTITFVVTEDLTYAGRNGITEHTNVMRKMVFPDGSQFDLNSGGDVSFTVDIEYHPEWNENNLSVVAFVQGNGKMVYQAGEIEHSDLSVTSLESGDVLPSEYFLEQNYPNPFNPETTIGYSLPADSFVQLKIYDILGNEVETLVSQNESAGSHIINFNAGNLTSGLYIYKLSAGDFTSVKKMMLLK